MLAVCLVRAACRADYVRRNNITCIRADGQQDSLCGFCVRLENIEPNTADRVGNLPVNAHGVLVAKEARNRCGLKCRASHNSFRYIAKSTDRHNPFVVVRWKFYCWLPGRWHHETTCCEFCAKHFIRERCQFMRSLCSVQQRLVAQVGKVASKVLLAWLHRMMLAPQTLAVSYCCGYIPGFARASAP